MLDEICSSNVTNIKISAICKGSQTSIYLFIKKKYIYMATTLMEAGPYWQSRASG